MLKRSYEAKRAAVIVKMAINNNTKGLYLTAMVQSLTACTNKVGEYGASLIAANSYPYISLDHVDGKASRFPVALGN